MDIKSQVSEQAIELLDIEQFRDAIFQTHHGKTTVFDHSVHVALLCAKLGYRIQSIGVNFDLEEMIRAALLHDVGIMGERNKPMRETGGHCLAIWHPLRSVEIASSKIDSLTAKEKNIIGSHMFPLTLELPKSKEAWLITIIDKIVAVREMFGYICPIRRKVYAQVL